MLFSLATLALAFVSGANAACERVQDVAVRVAAFPGGNSTIFCASWKSACAEYKPDNTSLVYYKATCLAGNFQLQNRTKEALVTCAFTADGGCTNTGFFAPIAAATNSSINPL